MSGRTIPVRAVVVAMTVAAVAGAALRGAVEERPSARAKVDVGTSPSRLVAAGPRRWVDGAPSGFSRNVEGARAAAVAYSTLGGTVLNLDPITLRRVASSISTSETAANRAQTLQESSDAVRQRLAGGNGPYATYQSPVLVRIDSFDDDQATVTLWLVSVVMRRDIAEPQSTWTTVTLTLDWERDDWRLASERSIDGPTPDQSVDEAPISVEEFEQRLEGAQPMWGPQ